LCRLGSGMAAEIIVCRSTEHGRCGRSKANTQKTFSPAEIFTWQ